jgi:hypothetical protein
MFDVANFKTRPLTAFPYAKVYRRFFLDPGYYPEAQEQSFPQ